MKTKLKLILSTLIPLAVFFAVISGCDDSGTNPTTSYIDNPNVKTFDSIGVDEDAIAFQSYTGIDLLTGRTTIDSSGSRDCSLQDLNNAGNNFYLQDGVYDFNDMRSSGHEIRFFRVDPDMSAYTFDTLSQVPGYTSFNPNDFTQNSTENWGYFNAPLSSYPVYCFWLKGKKDAGITSKDVYGIIQPREATDPSPGPYDFRMSFRVRINTNAENDFRKQILQTQ
jgi:hypothetical protein